MCNIEFPHFGASYPDAHCINGYLWDMDSYENGCYTIGGDDPCPFCNTEAWLKTVLDNEEFASREEALEWVEKMREKLGAKHRGSSEIPKDLEEAARKSAIAPFNLDIDEEHLDKYPYLPIAEQKFIEGAKWQKEQMMKEAVEGEVCGRVYDHINVRFADGVCKFLEPKNISHIPADVSKYKVCDKVRIIIVKE